MKIILSIKWLLIVVACSLPLQGYAFSPKSFVEEKYPDKNTSTSYDLYEGNNKHVIHVLYHITPKRIASILYDLKLEKTIHYEEFDQTKLEGLEHEKVLMKLKLNKVTKIDKKYQKGRGRYYEIFGRKLFVYVSGKCASPFDSYFEIELDGLIEKRKSILAKGDLAHIASEECEAMNFQGNINVAVKSIPIGDIWKVNENVYALSLYTYPAVLFLRKDLNIEREISKLKNLLVVDYDWLKEKNESLIRQVYEDKEWKKSNESVHTIVNKKMLELLAK